MRVQRFIRWLLCIIAAAPAIVCAQDHIPDASSELRLRIVASQPGKHRAVPAVLWLEPLAGTPALIFAPHEHYSLLQKDRTFIPHLQVVPVGSTVQFPNNDPFFHNVFSLFDGKRFDLGLYEAGSSRSVTFSKEGVSYIFCNIHPEMSAVVLALATPLYAIADADDAFVLRNIPAGDYKLRLWIEGVPQSALDGMGRTVHFPPRTLDLGAWKAPFVPTGKHANKFGGAYEPAPASAY